MVSVTDIDSTAPVCQAGLISCFDHGAKWCLSMDVFFIGTNAG